MIDLGLLLAALPAEIERALDCTTSPRILQDQSKLVIDIEAPDFVASISAWSNGSCDIDLLLRGTTSGVAWHRQFADTEAAALALVTIARGLPDLPTAN